MNKMNLLLTCLILIPPVFADTIVQETKEVMTKAEADSDALMKDAAVDMNKTMQSADDLVKGAELEDSNPISKAVGEKLTISTDMAGSGTSAMLAYAESQLKGQNLAELNKLVPGLSDLTDVSLTMDSIDSMDKVKSAFTKAGLDASQIADFSPIILDYLKQKGATSDLLGALTSLWTL